MLGSAMQRQNSMPTTGIPVEISTPQFFENNFRRLSHDVISIKVTRPRSGQHTMSQSSPVTNRLQSISGPSSNVTISFGFASNMHQREHVPVAKTNSTESNTTYEDEERPSTSTINSVQFPNRPIQVDNTPDLQTTEFYLRLPNQQVISLFCECPSGSEADLFLQSLPERQKDRLRRFIENEIPDVGEYYVWVQDNATSQVTVISLKTLENHFRNQHQRRVKWRHVSLDKVSVYRYSLPVITTKFRLRLVHFISRHYRCCILCVWCCVIFFISVGIVLTVVFGSAPQNTSRIGNYTTTPRTAHPYSVNEALNRNISVTNFLNYATNGGLSFQGG